MGQLAAAAAVDCTFSRSGDVGAALKWLQVRGRKW